MAVTEFPGCFLDPFLGVLIDGRMVLQGPADRCGGQGQFLGNIIYSNVFFGLHTAIGYIVF